VKELFLFSGAGGGLLGTHLLGWRPVGYVEIDDYCQRVLAALRRSRMETAYRIVLTNTENYWKLYKAEASNNGDRT